MLVLHQSDGQAAAPPTSLNSSGRVARIVIHENGVALATIVHGTARGIGRPLRIDVSGAQDQRKGCPATCKHLHT